MAPEPVSSSDPLSGNGLPPGGHPESFGRFRISRLLGQGGMGLVYLADDPKRDRQIALKVLAREKADNQTLLKRFRSEALATRELKHENIVGVYEAGSIDGQFYIALEFVDGTDVGELIQSRGRLPVRRSLDITHQVALALSVAHQRNIVHRDIKPSNLLIRSDGMVKLTDMGLARSLDDSVESGITRAGTTVGTVDYIAPEQARDSKAADTRSDIYSLGCTWYHMLTGQAVFPAGNLTDKLRHHATTPAPDPRRIDAAIPEDVVFVLQRMLEKLPERRHQNPDELAEALASINLERTEISADAIAALADEDLDPGEPHRAKTPRHTSTPSRSTPSDNDGRTPPVSAETKDMVPLVPIDESETGSRHPGSTANRRQQRLRDKIDDSSSVTTRPHPASPASHPSRPDGEEPVAPTPRKRSTSPSTVPPPSPRSRRRARQTDHEAPGGDSEFDWEKLKPIVLMILGVILLGLCGYALVAFSQSIDMSNKQSDGNPFGRLDDGTEKGKTTPGTSNNPEGADGEEIDPASAPGDAPVFDLLPAPSLAGKSATTPSTPPLLRQGERLHLFDWAISPPKHRLPILTVSRGRGLPGHFHSLDAALSAITGKGGWIQLKGPGPFFITAVELVDRGHVTISASKASRSVVVLRPKEAADTPASILSLSNTSLALHRIDLSPSTTGFFGDSRMTLISSRSSNLTLADCSITQPRAREGGTVAVALLPSSGDHVPRVLFDRVLARGRNTTLLELDSRSADIALVNSLLVSDAAPPISILTPMGTASNDDRRQLRLISCTLCSNAPLLQLDPGPATGVISETRLTVVNSLLACPSSGDRVLLDLGRWPQRTTTPDSPSRFAALTWEQHGSVSCGVREFIRRDAEVGLTINSFAQWQTCWKSPGEASAFVSTAWLPLNAEADRVSPRYFNTGRLGRRLPVATDGNPPGCRVLDLHAADAVVTARVPGQIKRPPWIPRQPQPRPVMTLSLADHPDLGRFLADHPPPSGAVVIVEGSGRNTTSPITIGANRLKLVFRDVKQGAPLVLIPALPPASQTRVAANKSSTDGKPLPANLPHSQTTDTRDRRAISLFTLDGGSLELVGGRFHLPESNDPAWLLDVEDGDFTILDCSLLGPRAPAQAGRGLINWSGSAPGGTGRIIRSYVAGSGVLLNADFRDRSLLVHDSLLFSTGSIFDLDLGLCSASAHSTLDIRCSSLSAAKSLFLIRSTQAGGSGADPDSKPVTSLNLFVDQTVFLRGFSPDNDDKPDPVLISCSSDLLAARMIGWSGTFNGFSPALTRYLHDPTREAVTDKHGTASDFADMFPPPARVRPLHGSEGVSLRVTPKDVTKTRPLHFRLDFTSRGRTWGPTGHSLGANIVHLESQLGKVGPPRSGGSGEKPDF